MQHHARTPQRSGSEGGNIAISWTRSHRNISSRARVRISAWRHGVPEATRVEAASAHQDVLPSRRASGSAAPAEDEDDRDIEGWEKKKKGSGSSAKGKGKEPPKKRGGDGGGKGGKGKGAK